MGEILGKPTWGSITPSQLSGGFRGDDPAPLSPPPFGRPTDAVNHVITDVTTALHYGDTIASLSSNT